MCDADDEQSQCAQGCVPPSFDKDALEVTDDEKADENEEFEMITEMKLTMEMMLDYGSTDDKLLEDVASELSNTLKPAFEKNNPFVKGTTTVRVKIQLIDQCVEVSELGINSEVLTGKPCECEAGKRRKRRNIPFQKVQLPVANVETGFNALDGESALTSPKAQKSLSERIEVAIKDLGSHTKHISDEQLCGYASTSLDTGVGYIKQAISSSANFMKMKGIQTKKVPSAPKFTLSKWMGSLPDNIKKLPLTLLAIPGTHQSGTSSLQKELVSESVYPWNGRDEIPNFLMQTYRQYSNYQRVKRFYAADKHLGQYNSDWKEGHPENELKYLEAWNTCQRSSISDQLIMGVRYFDFR